ncbi:MAG: type II secretion system F family protein, partial [Patescibacteria group bacterium]
LQRRLLIITSLEPIDANKPWFAIDITKWGGGVRLKDIVILSRQMATLFQARIPIVDSLKVLSNESLRPKLKEALADISQDIQGGLSIAQSLAKHPDVFSPFYINMVRAGEESGKLEQVFSYLAAFEERSYQLANKVRNAMIYPAFIFGAFILVMVLMLTTVIPRLTDLLKEASQDIPVYTRIVIFASDTLTNYGFFILAGFIILIIFGWRYSRGETGKMVIARGRLAAPIFGGLYQKLYLSRFADTLQTLIAGGVPVVRALEISADVVGNAVYAAIINDALEGVRAGASISDTLVRYPDIPAFVSQMIRIGEETGKLDFILQTTARFYRQEVDGTVDNLINLIEPIMILILGGGVGVLGASILIPIYNISSSI